MKTFSQYIEESFDKPYKYTLSTTPFMEYYGSFKLDDGSLVEVMFEANEHADDYEHTMWNIEFKRNGRQSETGEGDAMRIFATVIKMIEDFIKKENPKYILFSALKPADREDRKEKQSREKLYSRLVKRFSGKLGYTARENTFSGGTEWHLTRKK